MHVEERGKSEQFLIPDWVRTKELYMPTRRTPPEMTVAQLRRGMCFKSGGDWRMCETCPAPCGVGSQMIKYMTGLEQPPVEDVEDVPQSEARPEQPLPMPEKASSRTKYATTKRREIARRVIGMVEAGMPFAHAAREVGYTPAGMRSAIQLLGMKMPKNPEMQTMRAEQLKGRNDQRLMETIERYIAVTDAIAAGMEKHEAARKFGGYKKWDSCQNFGRRHQAEIEAVKAEKLKAQAVAD